MSANNNRDERRPDEGAVAEAVEWLTQTAAKRRQGVLSDVRRSRPTDPVEELRSQEQWATVGSVRLLDLEALLSALASASAERDEARAREELAGSVAERLAIERNQLQAEAASWKAEAATSFLALGEARELLERFRDFATPANPWAYPLGSHQELLSWLSKHGSKGK